MYLPSQFAITEPHEIELLLRSTRLGTLITHGPTGLFASPLPFIYDNGLHTLLAGHLAGSNPHRELVGEDEALVVFNFADAYVSPNWYPSKASDGKAVPTWNYEAIHVYGRLHWIDDAAWIRRNIGALSDRFEAGQSHPWSVDDAPTDFIAKLQAAIIGVELVISKIEAKRKMSQNRSATDQAGVIAGLTRSCNPRDHEVARIMAKLARD